MFGRESGKVRVEELKGFVNLTKTTFFKVFFFFLFHFLFLLTLYLLGFYER